MKQFERERILAMTEDITYWKCPHCKQISKPYYTKNRPIKRGNTTTRKSNLYWCSICLRSEMGMRWSAQPCSQSLN